MSRWEFDFRLLFRRPEVEHELDSELQYHIDRQTDLNIRRGITPAEARRQSVIAVGGIEPLKDDCRDARLGCAIDAALLSSGRSASGLLRAVSLRRTRQTAGMESHILSGRRILAGRIFTARM